MHIDTMLISLIQYGLIFAYIVLFFIIFAESGLLIGFFLPGDSLLFTAGFLASQGYMNIYVLVIGFFLAAVIGDSVGYLFGHKVGKRLFQRENSLLFHKDNLLKAKAFYEKHGGKTIILARFIPMVRTFAPIIAGIGDMHYRTFLAYNVIGGVFWAIGITLAGYFLGRLIPNVDRYLLPIVLVIIVLSVAPTAYHILKDPDSRKQILQLIKKTLRITK
ncbi:MAG: VTT domain-containing protein [Patescibacteria group bacterium]